MLVKARDYGFGASGFHLVALGLVRASRVAFLGATLHQETELPIVSIVVSFLGLTSSILRVLNGNPQKELQKRLKVLIILTKPHLALFTSKPCRRLSRIVSCCGIAGVGVCDAQCRA